MRPASALAIYSAGWCAPKQSAAAGLRGLRNMLGMQRLSIFFLLTLALHARADVYSWREGPSLKVSTVAPNWYREDRPVRGPRVLVMQGKRLIDDTGLPIDQRRKLRAPPKASGVPPVRKYSLPNY
jgi:hypothetical protein